MNDSLLYYKLYIQYMTRISVHLLMLFKVCYSTEVSGGELTLVRLWSGCRFIALDLHINKLK